MTRSPASHFRLPNLLTYLGLSAGALGTVFAVDPATRFWGGAGIAIAFACDLFDGRFARLFSRTEEEQRFGVEVDSLADVITFGLAPAVCVLRVVPAESPALRLLLFAAGLCYLLCIVTRLAHFNVAQAGTGGFVGLPSNMAALVWAILLFWVPDPLVASMVLILTGGAAVSGMRIPRPGAPVLYSLLAIALLVAVGHLYRLFAS
jgi:CDP-diacylglycerol--serine O-phosphatidyltransferase